VPRFSLAGIRRRGFLRRVRMRAARFCVAAGGRGFSAREIAAGAGERSRDFCGIGRSLRKLRHCSATIVLIRRRARGSVRALARL